MTKIKGFGTAGAKATVQYRKRRTAAAQRPAAADTIAGGTILTPDGWLPVKPEAQLDHRATVDGRSISGLGALGERSAVALSLREQRNLRQIDGMVEMAGSAPIRRAVINPLQGSTLANELSCHATVCAASGATGPTAAMTYQARQARADVDSGRQPFFLDIRSLSVLAAINNDDDAYASAMVVGGIDAFDYLRTAGFPDLGRHEDENQLEGILILSI